MELVGEQLIHAPRDRVWQALMDTETLRAAIPGCESVTDEGDGSYSAIVVAAVGPLRARFKGRLQQQEMSAPRQYGLRFEGEGGIAGFAKGTALVNLQETGEGGEHTRLSYRAETQIGGRLAQIGSRLIDATAARMSSQFFGRFEELLRAPVQPSGSATAVPHIRESLESLTDPPRPLARRQTEFPPGPTGGQFTLQMPAWTWALTLVVVAALAAWLGRH